MAEWTEAHAVDYHHEPLREELRLELAPSCAGAVIHERVAACMAAVVCQAPRATAQAPAAMRAVVDRSGLGDAQKAEPASLWQ